VTDQLTVLSVQSHVAYGHVGNSSAVFTMQRLGVEAWPVHTVQFSNHTGYGDWRGGCRRRLVEESSTASPTAGVLGDCDGVLSGYLGSADIGHAVLGPGGQVRAANPDAVYCCDPVLGDVGRGVFVRPGIPEFMAEHALPAATWSRPTTSSSTFSPTAPPVPSTRSRMP
jgi:pyridoxine kinase